MTLKDGLKVKHHANDVVFTLTKLSKDMYKVSWDAGGVYTAGYAEYKQSTVEQLIKEGKWIVVDEDSFATRLAFFQQHIDAVQENLESLRSAFEELKRTV